jgi:RNA polymerase sigma-70 factor (ECF subfamily)
LHEPNRERQPACDEGSSDEAQRVASLYLAHSDELRRFLRGVLRDAALADDVAQTAFARLIEALPNLAPEAAKSWLFRVAFHEALAQRRRQGVHRRAVTAAQVDCGARDDGQPVSAAVRLETVERVRQAMAQLPHTQREVVEMRMVRQMKFAEIAAALNIPLGTVLTRMRSALERLRDALPEDRRS